MPKSDDLKFKRRAAPETKRGHRTDCGENRMHRNKTTANETSILLKFPVLKKKSPGKVYAKNIATVDARIGIVWSGTTQR
jgi:hypothetical protein